MKDLHPAHRSKDGYFNTQSGIKVSIHHPTPDMIDIQDIAHALSNLCRFGGHTSEFYSVAQHSVLVQILAHRAGAIPSVVFAALMHDATEAYVQDVISPLKHILGEKYNEVERRFQRVIGYKFGITVGLFDKIKVFDRQALEIEHAYFFKEERHAFWNIFPEGVYAQKRARMSFFHTFKILAP